MSRISGAVLAVVLVACGPSVPATNPVTGLIVGVRLPGPVMTIKTTDGATFSFEMEDPNLTVPHMEQHRSMRWPVAVTFVRRGDQLVATRVADATRST